MGEKGRAIVTDQLRIAFLGGLPAIIGRGGLEIQMDRTADGLRSLGHEVVRAEMANADVAFDVLHVFGSEPTAWHLLRHIHLPAPIVVTPLVSISPGIEQVLLWTSARVPVLTSTRMRRLVLARANAIVALTEYEKH